MMTGQKIEEKLRNEFQPDYIQVEDESYRHHVPAGAESHFKVIIVTDRFAEQRLLARHRTIYSLLAEELDGPVHALALHTYTLEEWQRAEDKSLSSPDCQGAGRHT